MKAHELTSLFVEGKEQLARSEWTEAARTFFKTKSGALNIGDKTAAATAGYWQAASEVIAEDFGSAQSFKELLRAYYHWMAVDPDDRNEAKLRSTVPFCRAWLYILGDSDAPSEDEVMAFRDATEDGDTLVGVAAHLACEFALSKSSHKPGRLDPGLEQFKRFISCARNRGDLEKLPRCLTESYRSLADHLDASVAAGTQNGIHAAFQAGVPRPDDDSVFTYLSLRQCDRFYRSAVASLPATLAQGEKALAFVSIGVAWAGIVCLTMSVLGTANVITLLAFLGPPLGIMAKWRWLVLHRRHVLVVGILALMAAAVMALARGGM